MGNGKPKKGTANNARAAIRAAAEATMRTIDKGLPRSSQSVSRSRESRVKEKKVLAGRFVPSGSSNRGAKRQRMRRGRR